MQYSSICDTLFFLSSASRGSPVATNDIPCLAVCHLEHDNNNNNIINSKIESNRISKIMQNVNNVKLIKHNSHNHHFVIHSFESFVSFFSLTQIDDLIFVCVVVFFNVNNSLLHHYRVLCICVVFQYLGVLQALCGNQNQTSNLLVLKYSRWTN